VRLALMAIGRQRPGGQVVSFEELRAATLAQRMAPERNDPTMLGVAAWGAVIEMIAAGVFDLAQDELDSVTVPTNSPESMQLAGMLALAGSLVTAAPSSSRSWRVPGSRPGGDIQRWEISYAAPGPVV
jgi:hypothetical protein